MKKLQGRYRFSDGSKYPILEMTSGTTILVTPEDVENGEQGNPAQCAIAQGAMRAGYVKAWVSNTVAYLVGWHKGELVAFKYHVGRVTRDALKKFDATGEIPLGGFQLKALPKADRQAEKKIANEAYRGRAWGRETGHRAKKPYRVMAGPTRDDD